jgi:hypothetical protein
MPSIAAVHCFAGKVIQRNPFFSDLPNYPNQEGLPHFSQKPEYSGHIYITNPVLGNHLSA